MKALPRLLLLLLTMGVWPWVGRAQMTYTSQGATYLSSQNLGDQSSIQTFSGFSDITAVSWAVTNWEWNQTNAASGTFQTYIAQWDAANHVIIGGLTQFGGPASVSFTTTYATTNLVFSGNWTAPDPSLTYALVFTAVTGGAHIYMWAGSKPGAPAADFFATGVHAAFFRTLANEGGSVGQLESFMETVSNAQPVSSTLAWQMSVTGTQANLSPVPEPKTAAAGLAALFVLGLAGHRLWRQRKSVAEARTLGTSR